MVRPEDLQHDFTHHFWGDDIKDYVTYTGSNPVWSVMGCWKVLKRIGGFVTFIISLKGVSLI